MAHIPKKENVPIPDRPFDSEDLMAQNGARVLKQQRDQSGGLEDESQEGDAKVSDSKPYKNLKG